MIPDPDRPRAPEGWKVFWCPEDLESFSITVEDLGDDIWPTIAQALHREHMNTTLHSS